MPTENSRTRLQLSATARAALENRAPRLQGQVDLSLPTSAMIERYAFLAESGTRLLKLMPGFTLAHFACACDALKGTQINQFLA